MRVQAFDWDSRNVDHIARHSLEPFEVEGACRREAVIVRGRERRYLAYGCTEAGRYLLIVLHAYGGGRIRVITARDMTDRERRFYHQRRR